MTPAKKEKLTKLAHVLAGFIILFHGIEKTEIGHIAPAILFLVAGAVFIAVAIFHHRLLKVIRSVDPIFTLIEGLVALIVAVDYMHEHKHYLHYMYIFAALAYFTASIVMMRKAPHKNAH